MKRFCNPEATPASGSPSTNAISGQCLIRDDQQTVFLIIDIAFGMYRLSPGFAPLARSLPMLEERTVISVFKELFDI